MDNLRKSVFVAKFIVYNRNTYPQRERGSMVETVILKKNNLEKATELIRAGEIVAFPTDTVYGLGADATNEEAVKKVFAAKGRSSDRPLSVLVPNKNALKKYAKNIPRKAFALAEEFWPGPLTIILEKNDRLTSAVTGGKKSVGLRMPAEPLALKFIKACGVPLATPSANSTGRPSPTLAKHVFDDLAGKVPAIIDGGETSTGVESTVFDYSDPAYPVILRPGNISKEAIEKIIGQEVHILSESYTENSKAANQQNSKHYEPELPVFIVQSNWEEAISKMNEKGEDIAILADDELIQEFREQVVATYSLGKAGDINSANRKFFSGLRTLEKSKATVILARPYKNGESSEVYMNRLEKAAAGKNI